MMRGSVLASLLAPQLEAERVVQAAGFAPDYSRAGSPLFWRRGESSMLLAEAMAVALAEGHS